MRTFKTSLYAEFARIGKALASPARIEILDLVAQGEKTVEAIADGAGLTVKNASAHLRALRQARLVETRKEAQFVYYRLASDAVLALVRELQAVGRERLAEVDQVARTFLDARDELEPIDASELRRRSEAGDVTVLDVRPADEYGAGHIPGAVSIPVGDLERRLDALSRDREVVAYCRGPYCVYAVEAVEMLRRHGFRARRMDVGLPDWKLQGHPVETN